MLVQCFKTTAATTSDLRITVRRAHSAKIRQKIFSPDEISRIFPSKFKKIRKISISGHCMHLIFKMSNHCRKKYDQLLSRIFKISILVGFCYLGRPTSVVDHEKDCAAIADENKLCHDVVKNISSRCHGSVSVCSLGGHLGTTQILHSLLSLGLLRKYA